MANDRIRPSAYRSRLNTARVSASILLVAVTSCAVLEKGEILRNQRIKNAADRYASGEWPERVEAVRTLASSYRSRRDSIIERTLTAGADDIHHAVRIETANALSLIPEPWAEHLLRSMALNDRNDNVKWYAIRGLRKRRNALNAEVFIAGLESADWLIREESIRGICALDDETVRNKLASYVLRALNDPSQRVVLAALDELRVKDERFYRVIAEKLLRASDVQYSLLASGLKAVAGYCLDPQLKDRVIGLLVHRNARIRILALHALKKDAADCRSAAR